MTGVIPKFFIASAVMWIAPVAILYGYNNKIFPGSGELSSSSITLLSGFLAVISVNLVIAMYIIMAMRESSSSQHQPDPTFLANAKASISKPVIAKRQDSAQGRDKVD